MACPPALEKQDGLLTAFFADGPTAVVADDGLELAVGEVVIRMREWQE